MRVATVGNSGGVWEELSGEILQGPQCPDSKGGGTVPCIGCGLGVKTLLARCKDCGADYARFKKWSNRQYIFWAEFQRLAAIEIPY